MPGVSTLSMDKSGKRDEREETTSYEEESNDEIKFLEKGKDGV